MTDKVDSLGDNADLIISKKSIQEAKLPQEFVMIDSKRISMKDSIEVVWEHHGHKKEDYFHKILENYNKIVNFTNLSGISDLQYDELICSLKFLSNNIRLKKRKFIRLWLHSYKWWQT